MCLVMLLFLQTEEGGLFLDGGGEGPFLDGGGPCLDGVSSPSG